MKVTIKIACYSLIVCATLGASAVHAADDGIGFLDTLGRENSGRVVLGSSISQSGTAGYAVPVPFGPMINIDGVFGQRRNSFLEQGLYRPHGGDTLSRRLS